MTRTVERCNECKGTNGGHYDTCSQYGGARKEQVNHPAHYGGANNPYEAIKVIDAWGLDFCLGNTVKYIARAGKKDATVQDLEKARWYLDHKIKQLKGGANAGGA